MGAVMAGGVRRLCGVPVPMLEGRRQHWVGALSPGVKLWLRDKSLRVAPALR